MSQLSEAYEMQASNHPSNSESDEDQSLKCWEEVKAETGFSSYKFFLEALKEKGFGFGNLLEHLNRYGHRDDWIRSQSDSGTVVILDVLNDGSTSISLKMRLEYGGNSTRGSFKGSMLDSDRKSITPLLQNLRSPPKNVLARIVIWSKPKKAQIYPGIVDTLGLGLKIHPSYFETLLPISSYNSLRPDGSDYIKIGNNVATVARNYREQAPAPSVLIIAGNEDLYYRTWGPNDISQGPYRYEVEEVLKQGLLESEIGEGASLHRWAADTHPRNQMDYMTSGPPNYYLKLFSKYVEENCSFDSEDITPLLIAMLPLLHVEILRLRVQCGVVHYVLLEVRNQVENPVGYSDSMKQETYQVLYKGRFWLRRGLEALEEGRNSFVKLVRSQDAAEWLKSQTWLVQDESILEALAEARTVDAEVRDYMQLQIGNLSILESRKSIRLSNQQLDEAKRSKKCDSSSSWDNLLINSKPKYVGSR